MVAAVNPKLAASSVIQKRPTLMERLRRWTVGWKQALIAELASLGLPEEDFHE
jgi:hypothetical protein